MLHVGIPPGRPPRGGAPLATISRPAAGCQRGGGAKPGGSRAGLLSQPESLIYFNRSDAQRGELRAAKVFQSLTAPLSADHNTTGAADGDPGEKAVIEMPDQLLFACGLAVVYPTSFTVNHVQQRSFEPRDGGPGRELGPPATQMLEVPLCQRAGNRDPMAVPPNLVPEPRRLEAPLAAATGLDRPNEDVLVQQEGIPHGLASFTRAAKYRESSSKPASKKPLSPPSIMPRSSTANLSVRTGPSPPMQ